MSREEHEEYAQDAEGNVYRNLDEFRARRGQVEGTPSEGLVVVGSGDTGSDLAVFSQRSDEDELIVTEVWGHNSGPGGGNTFHLLEGDTDGSGGISNTTRRSVDIEVESGNTRREPYVGEGFTRAIGVQSEFAGQVAVGVMSDHKESTEPSLQQ